MIYEFVQRLKKIRRRTWFILGAIFVFIMLGLYFLNKRPQLSYTFQNSGIEIKHGIVPSKNGNDLFIATNRNFVRYLCYMPGWSLLLRFRLELLVAYQ